MANNHCISDKHKGVLVWYDDTKEKCQLCDILEENEVLKDGVRELIKQRTKYTHWVFSHYGRDAVKEMTLGNMESEAKGE